MPTKKIEITFTHHDVVELIVDQIYAIYGIQVEEKDLHFLLTEGRADEGYGSQKARIDSIRAEVIV